LSDLIWHVFGARVTAEGSMRRDEGNQGLVRSGRGDPKYRFENWIDRFTVRGPD
jgi:hypothetical protein